MRKLVVALSILAVAAGGAASAHGAAGTARHVHHFQGRVTSIHRAHHWLQIRTTSNRSVRIYTGGGTNWDHCGWSDMTHGHHVDVSAYRSHGRWMASTMRNWDDRDHHGGGHEDHHGMMG